MDRGSIWYRFAAWFCRNIIFRPLGGITIKFIENVPLDGALIVAPVHISHFDPPLVGSTCGRGLKFMAKKELFKFPLGPLIKSLGAFPVSRGDGDSAAIRHTLRKLSEGHAVLIFPEGTRGDSVTLGKIQIGLAMIAKRSGAKILPVGLSGPQHILPRDQKVPKRAKITVVFGEPFGYDEIEVDRPERANREAFIAELQTRLLAACKEAGFELLPPPS